MGLPNSGKTYLSSRLARYLGSAYFNGDQVRKEANDFDFSPRGRKRQAKRMRNLAQFEKRQGRVVVCDFICPTRKTRKIFKPDMIIWMDLSLDDKGNLRDPSIVLYQDTQEMFQPPSPQESFYFYRINKKMNNKEIKEFFEDVKKKVDVFILEEAKHKCLFF